MILCSPSNSEDPLSYHCFGSLSCLLQILQIRMEKTNGILHNIKLNHQCSPIHTHFLYTFTQPEAETHCPSALRCKCYYTIQETFYSKLLPKDSMRHHASTREVIHSNLTCVNALSDKTSETQIQTDEQPPNCYENFRQRHICPDVCSFRERVMVGRYIEE